MKLRTLLLPFLLVAGTANATTFDATAASSHALWLPPIADPTSTSRNFNFVGGSGVYTENGTASGSGATLTGTVSNGSFSFDIDFTFSGRINPGDANHPPNGSPKLELSGSSYAPNGPIDPDTWYYFADVTGVLTNTATGGVSAAYFADRTGPAAQVGFGANGKNFNFGLSTWLKIYDCGSASSCDQQSGVRLGGHGDINIDLARAPEPGALALVGLSLVGVGFIRRRR